MTDTADHALYDVLSSLNTLTAAMAWWSTRDDVRPQPEIRRAANTAMDAIDAMLADLHRMRARLMTEMRVSDDANMARAQALLEHLGAQNAQATEARDG